MTSLNTFGAILTYAIELEAKLAAYYQGSSRAADAEKRRGKLERSRRENVLEITLEPIDGLDAANYVMNLDDRSDAGQRAVEQVAVRFYTDVAPKINVREAQRLLEKCGKEHAALTG